MTSHDSHSVRPVAVVTGAGSLIGEGIARVLVRDGWFVVMTDLDLTHVHPVEQELDATEAQQLDVRDLTQVRAVINGVSSRRGRIDALVNGAGGSKGIGIAERPFVDFDQDDWMTILGANLVGTMNCTQAVLPHLIEARRGSIVSIGAGRGLRGGRNAVAYSAAKAGIRAFSQGLALEVGQYGVRVNTVIPGSAEVRREKGVTSRSPLGRHTTGEDIGAAVSFLCSERAAHITGASLDVSGGTVLH